MDSFGFCNIKSEKTNALIRYKRIQRLKSTFRLLEFCVFLILLSQFITYIPSVSKIAGDYFRGLSSVTVAVSSPMLLFLIGNAIVVVLILKSHGQSKNDDPINDFYEEYAKNRQRNGSAAPAAAIIIIKHEIKKEKKQLLCQEVVGGTVKEKKIYRSRSENLKRLHHHNKDGGGGGCREIRRTVTEKRRPKDEELEKNPCPEDEMSNDEFRRTIEAFIAKQQRALRDDEDLSIENCN